MKETEVHCNYIVIQYSRRLELSASKATEKRISVQSKWRNGDSRASEVNRGTEEPSEF
jgi:hypothetical protein